MVLERKGIVFILVFTFLFASCSTLPVPGENEQVTENESQREEPAPAENEEGPSFEEYEQITLTKGDHKDKIVISWEAEADGERYILLKSLKEDDAYAPVSQLDGVTNYEDKDIEPGMKVFYRLIRINTDGDETGADEGSNEETSPAAETAEIGNQEDFEFDDSFKEEYADALTPEKADSKGENYGYASVSRPPSQNLNRLMGSYKKGKTGPETENEKKYYKEHMAYLKEKYEHPVKLNMILTVTRPYINSGKLEVHTGFDSYIHVRSLRTVYIFNKNHTAVYIFNNNIISGSLRKENRKSLFNRLILNSVAFCGYTGEKEIKDENGYTRIVPGFDVVALAAQYWPQYRDWKNSTYLIVTSNKKLRREIQKAQSN